MLNNIQSSPCSGLGGDVQCCISSTSGGSTPSGDNLGGLDEIQSGHVRKIMAVAKSKSMPVRGCEIAMATALVESTIHVYANSKVNGSKDCPYDPGFVGQC